MGPLSIRITTLLILSFMGPNKFLRGSINHFTSYMILVDKLWVLPTTQGRPELLKNAGSEECENIRDTLLCECILHLYP
jgi:hypothetical protein